MLKLYLFKNKIKCRSGSRLKIATLLMFFFLAFTGKLQAQGLKQITGTVTSGGGALPGVSIKVKDSKTTAITNKDGNYTISAKAADVIIFTFIGMEKQEITVGAKVKIDVDMKDTQSSLNEILIVGYQSVKKGDLTGAVGQVKMADIVKSPLSSFTEALAGRVAGVVVSSNDGQPGNEMNITIRGAASINNSTQPLYVIDGFATESYENTNLNPDDIESITILKDAASTAIYGSRGTNGVIVITTKTGKVGKPVVSLNSSYGTQQIIHQIPLMNAYEFVKYQYEKNPVAATAAYLNNGATIESYQNDPGINWPNEITRIGSILKNEVAIRGGSDQTKYSISGAGFDQKGVLINTGYKRYQGRIRIDQTVNSKTKVGISADYMEVGAFGVQAASTPISATLSSALYFRTWSYRPVSGNLTPFDLLTEDGDPDAIGTSDIRINPKTSAENEYNHNDYNNLNINAYLNYSITKNLVLKVIGIKNGIKYGTDRFFNSQTPQGSPLNPLRQYGIYGSTLSTTQDVWSNENTLTYTQSFNKHNITVIAGNSQTSTKRKSYGYTSAFLPEESLGMAGLDAGTAQAPIASASSNALASFFGLIDYNFNSKYYFKAALRADGSSKFAKRWGYFPSIGAAWNMQNEDFMKKLPYISNSKIRVSYGITGNNRIGDFDWQPQIQVGPDNGYTFNLVPNLGAYTTGVENRGLTWERTTTTDVGYELGLFNNRLEIAVDIYRRLTRDLLISGAPLAAYTGFSSATQNVGSLQNDGLELTVNGTILKKKSFKWDASFNISFNKNKIVALARDQPFIITTPAFDVSYREAYISEVGKPLGQMYGLIWEGNYQYSDFNNPSPGVYILKPNVVGNGSVTVQPGDIKYRDLNGDGVIDNLDRTVIGRGQPIHTGGFSNNFTYKNFTLNAFFQWSYGNDINNANRILFEGSGQRANQNQFASYEDRWSPTNQDSRNFRVNGQGTLRVYSSQTIEDGSYLRLKTVQLGYNVPAKIIRKLNISSLSFNISAQNLITWTKYMGVDPEVSTRGGFGLLSPGFDFSPYPPARTLVFGFNASF